MQSYKIIIYHTVQSCICLISDICQEWYILYCLLRQIYASQMKDHRGDVVGQNQLSCVLQYEQFDEDHHTGLATKDYHFLQYQQSYMRT